MNSQRFAELVHDYLSNSMDEVSAASLARELTKHPDKLQELIADIAIHQQLRIQLNPPQAKRMASLLCSIQDQQDPEKRMQLASGMVQEQLRNELGSAQPHPDSASRPRPWKAMAIAAAAASAAAIILITLLVDAAPQPQPSRPDITPTDSHSDLAVDVPPPPGYQTLDHCFIKRSPLSNQAIAELLRHLELSQTGQLISHQGIAILRSGPNRPLALIAKQLRVLPNQAEAACTDLTRAGALLCLKKMNQANKPPSPFRLPTQTERQAAANLLDNPDIPSWTTSPASQQHQALRPCRDQ